MQRNALGSICFHAFLIFSVSCTNLYLRPAFIRTHAFIGSPNIRLVRALQDGLLQDNSESNRRSSYSSAKAVANSEPGQFNTIGQMSANPENINYYNQGLDGYGPVDPSEYESSQAIAQATSQNSQANAQADAQANAQGDGQSYAHAESQANSGAHQLQYDNPIPYYQQSSLPNYATAQAHSEANAEGRSVAFAEAEATVNSRSPDQEIPEEDEPSSGMADAKSGAVSSIANALAGAYSRIIPRHRYLRPQSLPGGRNIIQCSAEGEMHNFWSPVYDCMVCVCLRENYNLVASCVKCDTCQLPQPDVVPIPQPDVVPIPQPDVVPIPQPPLPQPESRVSCDPLPTDTPFLNPMNSCQICLCQRSINAFGQPDVQVTCEENPQCQQPQPEPIPQPQPQPDIIPIPDDNIVPVPEPQPVCDGHTPNIPFLDPVDACKICVCIVEVSYGRPDYRIICQPDPECKVEPFIVPRPVTTTPPPAPEPQPYPEPIPDVYPIPEPYPDIIPIPDVVPVPEPIPYPEPVPVPDVYPIPEPVPDIIPVPDVIPEPMPWPPAPVPPGPLPGPPPHESCRPYPPNRPFQHPWDQCQVCVCSEIISATIINIEVNCYTSKSCCVEPPFPEPTPLPLPGPRPPYSAPPANVKYTGLGLPLVPTAATPVSSGSTAATRTDRLCEYRSLEVDFVSPSESCKICKCRLYGNLVAPSCRRSQRPECAVVPVPTPTRNVVYIEPRCRYRMPHQNFQVDGNICVCEPIYRYVIAKCVKLRPNLDIIPWPSDQGNVISSAHSSAQAHSQISQITPVIPSHYSSNIPSGSFGINIPLNGYVPNIGYNIKTNPEINVNPMYYNGVINPQTNINSEPGNVIYPNYNGNNNQYSGSQAIAQADAESSKYNAESHAQAESSATSYNSNADASAISNSQANAHAESSADSYYDVNNLYNLRRNKALANSVANANVNYGGQIYANNPYNGQYSPTYNAWNVEPIGGPGTQANAVSNAQSYAQANSQSNVQASAISNVQAAGQAGSQANAQANVISNSQANAQSNAQVYRPSNGQYGSVDGYYPYSQTDTQANSQASALALANILNYAQPNAQNNAQAYRPSNGQNGLVEYGYQPYSQTNTQADSQASAQALVNNLNYAQLNAQPNAQTYGPSNGQYGLVDGSYPYYQANTQADSQATAEALANIIKNAQANAQNNAQAYRPSNGERGVGNGYFIYSQPNSYPYSPTNTQADSQASAQALANALNNAQVNAPVYSPPNGQYGSEDGYYPYPQTNTQADSQAYAQAVTNAQANAQSNGQPYGQSNAQANSQVFGQGLASALSNSQSNAISSSANAQSSAQASAQAELGANSYASQAQASSQASSGALSYTPMYGTSNLVWRPPLGSSMYNDKYFAPGNDLVQPGETAQASASAQASSSIFDAGESHNLVIPGTDERPNILTQSSKIVPIMRSGEERSGNEDPLISINQQQDEVLDQEIEAPQEASALSPQQPELISRR